MKILFLTNGYPPTQTAGTEIYTAGIATEFSRRGHEVRVICGGDWDTGPLPFNGISTEVYDGVTVMRINLNWAQGPNPNRSLYNNPATEEFVFSALDEYHPDVVHITSCYTLSASILRAVKLGGYPLIVTLTDFWFICPRVSLLRSDGQLCDGQTSAWTCLKCSLADSTLYQRFGSVFLEPITEPAVTFISKTPSLSRQRGFLGLALNMSDRKALLLDFLGQADVLISPSKFLAHIYAQNGVKSPIRVIDYGHDLSWVPQIKPTKQTKRIVFGFIGRLTNSKGAHIFVEALSRVSSSSHMEGRIWGDADQEPEYFMKLQAMGVAKIQVNFCGKFSRSQIAGVFSQIDVLVVPSIWHENNPLVIQESFAAGIPVIASNLGGMAEFVQHGLNGLLFTPGDAGSLASTMLRCVEEEGLLRQLRDGIPIVKSVEDEIRILGDLYQEVVAKSALLQQSVTNVLNLTQL